MAPLQETAVNVLADINFLQRLTMYNQEKPYANMHPASLGARMFGNVRVDRHRIELTDLRSSDCKLAREGFQLFRHQSKCLPLYHTECPIVIDGDTLQAYKDESQKFLASLFPDADYIICWDAKCRMVTTTPLKSMVNPRGEVKIEAPSQVAHVDSTPTSASKILRRQLPPNLQDVVHSSQYRCRLINTWRPLVPIVRDRPLALCDYSSMNPQDIVGLDLMYPNGKGEAYVAHYNRSQRWFWCPEQTPQDLLTFINYDSAQNDEAKYCVHTSFDNPLARGESQPRASIETRSIIISKA